MVASRTDGTVEWILSDQLGSPNTIIDATTGATTRRLFDPFGTVRFDDGVETDRSFTGQYGDPSTGLLFYNARYYDPLVGRFVSPDSIVPDPANPQDLNRYSYVRNNPVSYTDPTGNWPFNGCGNTPLFSTVCNLVSRATSDPVAGPIARPLVEGVEAVEWGVSELAGYTDIGDGWTLLSGRDTHGDPVGGVERGLAAGGVFLPWFSGKLAKTLLKYADTALLNTARRTPDGAGSFSRGSNGLFGSDPTALKLRTSGGFVRDAGRPVQVFQTEVAGGRAAAESFFALQTGVTPSSAVQTIEAGGLRFTIRPSSHGAVTVDVFDSLAATVEKIRFVGSSP